MNKKGIIALLIAFVAFASNCTSTQGSNQIAGAKLGSFLDIRALSRKDYKVIGNVKGEASFSRTRILLPIYPLTFYNFGVPGLSDKRESGSISGYPTWATPLSPLDYTQEQAIYNALEKLDSADAVLQPKFKWKCETTQAFLYSDEKCTVTVIGKAIAVNEG
ncbi:hypothetical protein EHO59_17790 [Leptospira semungkisensis]|uniref:Lipoprotein n=1 Tax=Leptospira semungkisensis TaxID=2484985 RepID=A0A4R9FLZ0_9LEPT|nr:hypothetical protein [Leptospira semungkisensis]TGJ99685.1 hypothetical protein EHO59_17790 [Leptospira semungkisensis]